MGRRFRDIYNDFLNSKWVTTPILAAENEWAYQPKDLTPWLSVEFSPFFEELVSLGGGCYRAEGEVTLRVWVASGGTETDEALDYIEQLRDMHRGATIGEGVRFGATTPAEEGGPSSDGNWFNYKTNISYLHDYQK